MNRGRRVSPAGTCSAHYNVARWVTCADGNGGAKEMQRFIDGNAHRVALDAVDAPCVVLE